MWPFKQFLDQRRGGGALAQVKAGDVPDDRDFTDPVDGLVVVDTHNSCLWLRVRGEWQRVYAFRFANLQYPELHVPPLDVRFTHGYFETDDLALAVRVAALDGVSLLDETTSLNDVQTGAPNVPRAPVALHSPSVVG